jgi:hypothetical protein
MFEAPRSAEGPTGCAPPRETVAKRRAPTVDAAPPASRSRYEILRSRRAMSDEIQLSSSDRMLITFVGFLHTRMEMVKLAEPDPDLTTRVDKILAEIGDDPSAAKTIDWDGAYRLERELMLLQKGELLRGSVAEYLDDADETGLPSRVRLRAAYNLAMKTLYDNSTPPALIRGSEAVLWPLGLKILEDSQWQSKQKYLAIPEKRTATHRIVTAGLVSFALFLWPAILICLSPAVKSLTSWDANANVPDWSGLVLWTVLTSGLLGAFFSRLLYFQGAMETLTLEELGSAKTWRSLIMRGAVGMIGALVIFYFLKSSLVAGSLVPDFKQTLEIVDGGGSTPLAIPTKDLALLAIWCFLAGFSERLVPTILSAAESEFAASAPKASDQK